MKNIAWRQIGLEICAWTAAAARELFKLTVRWCKGHQRLVTKIEKVLLWTVILATVALVCSRTVRKQESAKYAAALQAAELRHNAELEQARTDIEEELKTEYGFDQIDQERDQIQVEAEWVARVLQGMNENSERGKKSICWCIFNRVDNPLYGNTVESVVNQASQWVGYHSTNTITQENYNIAYAEVLKWHSGGIRPMRADFLYLSWSSKEIVLRTQFTDGRGCHYWYEDDWADAE